LHATKVAADLTQVSTVLVHKPDPEYLAASHIRRGNFYHTFFGKLTFWGWWKIWVDVSKWKLNSGKCIVIATKCQILASALDDVKCHISATMAVHFPLLSYHFDMSTQIFLWTTGCQLS